jgi:polar amino acid transport system substrate-binding protein
MRHRAIIPSFLLAAILVHFCTAAADEAPGAVYRSIMRKKTIHIGVSKDYPPLNFEAGRAGVEMEMARMLGEFLGVSVRLTPLDVNEYIPAIERRKVDILIAGVSRTLSRARTIWFSEPYLTVTPGVLADSRSIPQTRFSDEFEQQPLRTLWDLKALPGFRFAVKAGSTYEHILAAEFPAAAMVVVSSNEEALEMLRKGTVNGFVHDSLYLEYLYANSAKLRSAYVLLKGGTPTEKICVGLPFGDTILKTQVDTFIQEILRQGLVDQWLSKFSVRDKRD